MIIIKSQDSAILLFRRNVIVKFDNMMVRRFDVFGREIERFFKIEIDIFVKITTLDKRIIVAKMIIFEVRIITSFVIAKFRRFSRDDIDFICVFLYSLIRSLTKPRFSSLY